MNITKALIRRIGRLAFLLLNTSYGCTRTAGPLPSWTPDWLSHKLPEEALELAEKPRGHQQVLVAEKLPIESRMTLVQGVVVGTIPHISSAMDDISHELNRAMSSLRPATLSSYYSYPS